MNEKLGSLLLCALLITSGCMERSPPDMDGDGIQDSEDVDVDGDGWENSVELNCTSDPNNANDVPTDTDGDAVCNVLDEDDDDDLWSDSDESLCKTDSLDANSIPDDLDDDGKCDDLDEDADGDDLPNDWEIERGFDPMDADDYLSCHGRALFCIRSYDDFTFPQTHNSFVTSDSQFVLAVSHFTGLEKQWEGGVRAFMLDTHHRNDVNKTAEDVLLCHSTGVLHPCAFGSVNPVEWLFDLKQLMDNSSNDVVSIKFESYVPASHLEYLFNVTGLKDRVYSHTLGEAWPSIGDLVLQGKNLVIFQQSHVDEYPWLHGTWRHTWETSYELEGKEDMDCKVDRGDGDQSAWVLNHFLKSDFGTPDPIKSVWANDYETIVERVLECWEEVGNRPTFFAVDFWEEGELVNATIALNQMNHWTDDVPDHP